MVCDVPYILESRKRFRQENDCFISVFIGGFLLAWETVDVVASENCTQEKLLEINRNHTTDDLKYWYVNLYSF